MDLNKDYMSTIEWEEEEVYIPPTRPNFKDVPKEVWDDLEYRIAANSLEYADNFRAYRASDMYLFEEYEKALERGCCGFFEDSTIINGEKWVMGCNHGH